MPRQLLWLREARVVIPLLIALLLVAGLSVRHATTSGIVSDGGPQGPVEPLDLGPRPDSGRPTFSWQTLGSARESGVSVELRVAHLDPAKAVRGTFREGDNVLFSFKVRDTAIQQPITKVNPAAWLMPGVPDRPAQGKDCYKTVESLVNGRLFNRATLDFNSYQVLTLHADSIGVYDPLMGFGGSRMLSQISLGGRAGDWVPSRDSTRLFVSLSDARRVVVIGAGTWEAIKQIDINRSAQRIGLQPDGHYVWVAEGDDAVDDGPSGVSVIDADALNVVTRIATGKGPHALAFSDDSRYAFVTNGGSGTVSIIDVRTLGKIADCPTGQNPVAIDYSGRAGWAYVAHEGDGRVVAVDPKLGAGTVAITLAPGLSQLRLTPDGRHGFVINPKLRELAVFEVAANRVVQQATFTTQPEQVSFSTEMAYVRHRDSPNLTGVQLKQIGAGHKVIALGEIPIGRDAFGAVESSLSAETMVQAPGENSRLIAHASDRAVYYYKEGMSAPMGALKIGSGQPRAVLALDRSLRERSSPGEYESAVKLPEPGHFDVVFYLSAPRLAHCFSFQVEADPVFARARNEGKVDFEWLGPGPGLTVGKAQTLRFRLLDPVDKGPKTDLKKVGVIALRAPGVWNERATAIHEGEGVFAFTFTAPEAGVFYVYLQDASLKLTGFERPLQILHASPLGS